MPLQRVWIPSPNYSSRGGADVRLIVLHTAEGALTFESLGGFFGSSSSQVSSHVGIDDKLGIIGEYVKRPNKAWTQSNFNPVAVSVEMCGFVSWSTDTWLNQHANMLANTAAWIAEEAAYWNIPIVRLSDSEAQGSGRGVCDHRSLGPGGGGHSDVGPNFPWDYVMNLARGGSIPTLEDQVAIAATQNKDGRLEVFVEKDDGTVMHTWQKSPGGAWEGSKPGQHAGWQSMGKP